MYSLNPEHALSQPQLIYVVSVTVLSFLPQPAKPSQRTTIPFWPVLGSMCFVLVATGRSYAGALSLVGCTFSCQLPLTLIA